MKKKPTGKADLASQFFEFTEAPQKTEIPFEAYGGKFTQIRIIPVVRKKLQTDLKGVYVNCTSSGSDGEKQLSPFFLGPCRLYRNKTSRRMENAWQFSKVFERHVGQDGNPTNEYFEWAAAGWSSWKPERYPMGKGVRPKFHWWDGKKLNRAAARKQIYVPLYVEQVVKKPFFGELRKSWRELQQDSGHTLYLMDFDAYPYGTMSFTEVLNNPDKPMGHGFVLAMLLTNDVALRQCELREGR